MLRVNLLPWRERLRDRRARFWQRFLLFGLATGALILTAASLLSQQAIRRQEQAVGALGDYRTALQGQLEKVKALENDYREAERLNLQTRQRFSRSLQYVGLLQQLSQVMPQEVWATQLSQNAAVMTLEGRSTRYEEILTLSRALPHDTLFPQTLLREVKQLPAEDLSFSLNATLQSAEGK
ncbi:PilN domain-containing protein [Rouxiella sp. T17]|uniref:PilN domain-containing protein n=1 Tax=Rouxiella sp. T17 TaxID=3085684 RepID=UPI002FC6D89F